MSRPLSPPRQHAAIGAFATYHNDPANCFVSRLAQTEVSTLAVMA